jgi:biopolymer transport protein ExbD
MRHLSISEIKAEPNLVPLLDLVFQLIMFFMICVNFVSEQINEDIKLPTSQSARPMDKSEVEVLFLNLDPTGKVIVPGEPRPLTTPAAVQSYLRQQYHDAKRAGEERGDKSGKVSTSVIIRADRDATYAQVFLLLKQCRDVGYQRLQLRAYSKGS